MLAHQVILNNPLSLLFQCTIKENRIFMCFDCFDRFVYRRCVLPSGL